jgi:hypothetical protein
MSSAVHFFNTHITNSDEHRSDLKNLNELANICFTPIRHFFGGRHVHVIDNKVVAEFPFPIPTRAPQKDYRKTALMVALFIPGLIVGTVARVITLLSAGVRLACMHVTKPYIWLKPDQTTRETVQQRLAKTETLFLELQGHLQQVENVWSKEFFLGKLDTFFNYSFQTIEHLLAHAEGETENPVELANLLRSVNVDSYGHSLWFNSFVRMYHAARSHLTIDADWHFTTNDGARFGSIEQTPYFTPHTREYRWREMFNKFCQRLETLGIHQQLNKDLRFKPWVQPDLAFFADDEKIGPPIIKI